MRSNAAVIAILIVSGLIFGGRLDSKEAEEFSEGELRDRVIAAKTSHDSGRAFARYFKEVGRNGLDRLKNDADTGIALEAAWEQHAVVMPEELDPDRDVDSLPPRVLRAGDAQRFFGFLEGRTGLEIPEWWEGRRNFPPRLDNWERPIHEFEETDFSLRDGGGKLKVIKSFYGPKSSAVRVNEGLLLSNGSRKLIVAADVVEKWKNDAPVGTEFCDFYVGGERSYVAIYNEIGFEFPLFCIETKSGKLLWKVRVWGQRLPLGMLFTGSGYHHEIELDVSDERVEVWGAGLFGSYVESFAAKTGAVRFRFSTEYRAY
jgi:hypothetical protein